MTVSPSILVFTSAILLLGFQNCAKDLDWHVVDTCNGIHFAPVEKITGTIVGPLAPELRKMLDRADITLASKKKSFGTNALFAFVTLFSPTAFGCSPPKPNTFDSAVVFRLDNGKAIVASDPLGGFSPDLDTFTYVQNLDVGYAIDKNNIYYLNQIVAGADRSTFKIIRPSIAEDSLHFYNGSKTY